MCTCCMDYFTTSTDAMCWHDHICKSTTGGNNDDREEDDNDNGDEDDEFMFEED